MQLSRIYIFGVSMILLSVLFFSAISFSQDASLETIEITHKGTSNTLVDFVPSVTTLKNKELKKRRENTLGDTLKSEVGVQTSSFGPNASRPIIRGLDGDRIRVLQNGLGVLDASSQSVDHAVPVDTLIIDSLEIVRGPMSMLYGSSAVGGVVNINTTRIHSTYEEGAIQDIQILGDSSQNAVGTGAKIDYGSENWMIHFDGGYRNANNLKIPGNEYSDHASPAQRAEHDGKNELDNSGSVQKSVAVGVSRIFERGFLGLSLYKFDNFYGAVAEKEVDIKMRQDRLELHGEYLVRGNYLKSVRLKTAQSDYGHQEFESGDAKTAFNNEGNESRLEFMTESESIKGISGVQSQIFNFGTDGIEAFLAPSNNRGLSAFTLQDYAAGDNVYSLGARAETSFVENQENQKSRSFNGFNSSLGFRHSFSETHVGSISLSYTERLPNFQELYARGMHVATGTYEEGSGSLNKEKAFALDLGLKYTSSSVQTSLSIFAQEFKDYISLFKTSELSGNNDEISRYSQVDAQFYGFEFDGKKALGETPFNVILKGDFVRGRQKHTGDNLPRITPPRVTLGLEMLKDRWVYDVEAQYNFEQTFTAENETRTDSFTLLNASVFYDLVKTGGKWSFFGRLKNILNQEARLHTSLLKDIAPLAGRNISGGVQYSF